MADYELPRTKLWENVIVLECECGLAVDYPGHEVEDGETVCEGCGVSYGLIIAEQEKS